MRSWSDAEVVFDAALDTTDPLAALYECARRGLPGPILADNGCGTHCHVHIMPDWPDVTDADLRENLEDWTRSGACLGFEVFETA